MLLAAASAGQGHAGPTRLDDASPLGERAEISAGAAPNPHYPKDGEWKGTIDGLVKMAEDIKGGAEISMLQLQQLMAQRQTAVQLTTNMMSKLDQTQDSIVKNV